jgi:imidazolonepropionase
MQDLGIIDNGYLLVKDGLIAAIGSGEPPEDLAAPGEEIMAVDADGRVVMPAFVDCHTHACWAGSRLDEFEMGLRGATYLQILEHGGGIMSTVRATRDTSREELADLLCTRLGMLAAAGTGTVEVKSGYGLTTEDEVKMLRAVHDAAQGVAQSLVGTFLGAHAIDPTQEGFIDRMIEETLPAVAAEFPGITCDAYCETGAWSVDEVTRLFERATELGCPLRIHVDQFNSLGMLPRAVDMGAVSADHLEASTVEDLRTLAASKTVAVLLPASGFCLDGRYADGRSLIDMGAAVAIATNFNPGSAPSPSMAFSIALAARRLRLTPAEAITSTTHNAACVLGMQDSVGSLDVGMRADIQLLDCEDERELAWQVAGGGPLLVAIGGDIVHLLSESVEEEEES